MKKPDDGLLVNFQELAEKNKFKEALDFFEINKSRLEGCALSWNILGFAYYSAGKTGEAVKAFRQAIEIDSSCDDAFYNLGKIMHESINHNHDGQIIIYKKYPPRVSFKSQEGIPDEELIHSSLVEIDAPLVSIVVLAYNKLEYTRQCIESIYKYSADVDYELILVDNGSSDGTFEYFQTLEKKCIVRIENNQGPAGAYNEGMKVARGKYIAVVCNDLIFCKNWLSNLVKCMESDSKIAFAAPGGNNISNLQAIELKFSDLEEMQEQAAKYNVSDPAKWEERLRLVPPVFFVRRSIIDVIGMTDPAYYFGEFGDDYFSFKVRRAGYKVIFCGDTFIFHYGSTTVGQDQAMNNSLQLCREIFTRRHYGIDSWQDIYYDPNLINTVDINAPVGKKTVQLLGIEPSLGNTLVMLKNAFRKAGITDVKMHAYSADAKYYYDLKTICGKVEIGNLSLLATAYGYRKFDVIIIDKPLGFFPDWGSILKSLKILLSDDGQAVFYIDNHRNARQYINWLKKGEDLPGKSRVYTDTFEVQEAIKSSDLKISALISERAAPSEEENAYMADIRKFSVMDSGRFDEALTTNRYFFRVKL